MVHKQRLCVLHFKTAARIEALMDGFFGRRQCGFVGHGEATTLFFGHGVNDFFLGDSIKRLKDLMDNSSMEQEYPDKFPKPTLKSHNIGLSITLVQINHHSSAKQF